MRQAVESWLQKQATCSAWGNQSNGKVIFLTNGVKAKRENCCYVRNNVGSRSNGPASRREGNIVLGFRIMMQFPYILLLV